MDGITQGDSFFADGGFDALVDSAAGEVLEAAEESAGGPPSPVLGDDEVEERAGGEASPEEGEADPLSEREREIALREQRLAAQEAERQRQEREAAWGHTWNNGMSWFAQAEQQIWRTAENQVDPEGYVRERLGQLNQKRAQWVAEYYQNLDTSRQEEMQRARIPEFAAYLIERLGLPKTDYDRLMRYRNDPDMMAQVAQDLRDIRQAQKTLAKDGRRQPSPGSGSGSGGKRPRSLDEYLDTVLTT